MYKIDEQTIHLLTAHMKHDRALFLWLAEVIAPSPFKSSVVCSVDFFAELNGIWTIKALTEWWRIRYFAASPFNSHFAELNTVVSIFSLHFEQNTLRFLRTLVCSEIKYQPDDTSFFTIQSIVVKVLELQLSAFDKEKDHQKPFQKL